MVTYTTCILLLLAGACNAEENDEDTIVYTEDAPGTHYLPLQSDADDDSLSVPETPPAVDAETAPFKKSSSAGKTPKKTDKQEISGKASRFQKNSKVATRNGPLLDYQDEDYRNIDDGVNPRAGGSVYGTFVSVGDGPSGGASTTITGVTDYGGGGQEVKKTEVIYPGGGKPYGSPSQQSADPYGGGQPQEVDTFVGGSSYGGPNFGGMNFGGPGFGGMNFGGPGFGGMNFGGPGFGGMNFGGPGFGGMNFGGPGFGGMNFGGPGFGGMSFGSSSFGGGFGGPGMFNQMMKQGRGLKGTFTSSGTTVDKNGKTIQIMSTGNF